MRLSLFVAAILVMGCSSAHGQSHASMNGVDFDSDITCDVATGRSLATDYRAWDMEISSFINTSYNWTATRQDFGRGVVQVKTQCNFCSAERIKSDHRISNPRNWPAGTQLQTCNGPCATTQASINRAVSCQGG